MKMSPTSRRIIELRDKMGDDPENVLKVYNPCMQLRYTDDEKLCYFGSAPTLWELGGAYGRNISRAWLEVQLNDLAMYAGVREKLTPEARAELAVMIMKDYAHYKLTELMLFFQKYKRCKYGRFYGMVDPMAIFGALQEFDLERRLEYAHHEAERVREEVRARQHEHLTVTNRYLLRVDGATSDNPPMSLLQYRLLGYDDWTDEAMADEVAALKRGDKTLPSDISGLLALSKQINP